VCVVAERVAEPFERRAPPTWVAPWRRELEVREACRGPPGAEERRGGFGPQHVVEQRSAHRHGFTGGAVEERPERATRIHLRARVAARE
jgi:hypothetical protein